MTCQQCWDWRDVMKSIQYTDVSGFTNCLGAYFPLSRENFGLKWVFWLQEAYQKPPIIQNNIRTLLREGIFGKWLIQFWAPIVVGNRCYLRTSEQPFAVDGLYKGMCWYRKLCMEHGDIIVDEGAKEEQLGAVGRVYLNGYPESSPDLRLYSTKELPLRDYAARCGARAYLVLPIFDLYKKECHGVLECLDFLDVWNRAVPLYMLQVHRELQKAELRTTHLKFNHLKTDLTVFDVLEDLNEGVTGMVPQDPQLHMARDEITKMLQMAMELVPQLHMARDEITKMLQMAMEIVPQLHMAQVWIPCDQCANTTTSLCCMELVDSIQRDFQEKDMNDYLLASNFHNLQLRKGVIAKTVTSSSNTKSCFCQNICDFSQSENPLAHYAQKARLSFCFAVCLESLHNSDDLFYVEFFLQPNSRHDPGGVSLCHLLIGAMKTILKSFKVPSSDMSEVRKDVLSNSIKIVPYITSGILEGERHQYLKEPKIFSKMNRGWEVYPSELEFQKYLQMDDHFSCFKSHRICTRTWLFCCPEEELSENDENYSFWFQFLQDSTQEKIELLLTNLISRPLSSLVQFWAPIMIEGRHYLSTSGQTFALFGLHKGLALLRKRCMEYQYLADEGLNKEGHGPIGRVFRSWYPETTHDVSLYSTTEFPVKDDAAFCNLKSYIAFPLFDQHHKCLGVLEFIGICEDIGDALKCIQNEVKAVHLNSTHICNSPKFQASFAPALNEIKEAFRLVNQIPQLHLMKVWVPHEKCTNTNNSLTCMQGVPISERDWELPCVVVETGKGIVGSLLASENKCCYCKNSCQFSVTEQSLSHHAQRKRLDVCFAICLQSSYTGYVPFVLNFFLNQGPGDYEYLWTFLYFLLPILKQQLKSFKVATGKQLGDELVVDIIEFAHEVNRPTLLHYGQQNMFPVKFQIVQYAQQEHQQSNDQQGSEMDHVTSAVVEGNQSTTPVANLEKEAEETSRRIEKGKTRTGLRITLEDLERQVGKSRENAAKDLSVSISTFKRACRSHNIHRWQSNKKQRKNPSLCMTKDANAYDGDPQQSTGPSSSSLRPPLDENVPPTNTEGNRDLTAVPETDLVIVKAKYGKIVKFKFCLSWGLDNLCKEVATRLKLEMESFELQYVDEDNDHISLTCNDELQLYVESAKAAGKNCISVIVQLEG